MKLVYRGHLYREAILRKTGPSEWTLYSRKKNPKTGKRRVLGRGTKSQMKKREQQVAYFKRQGDRIPGGLSDRVDPKDFDPAAVEEGRKVEMEHTDDPEIAREIARDHLTEDPQYYVKLRQVEAGAALSKDAVLELCKEICQHERWAHMVFRALTSPTAWKTTRRWDRQTWEQAIHNNKRNYEALAKDAAAGRIGIEPRWKALLEPLAAEVRKSHPRMDVD